MNRRSQDPTIATATPTSRHRGPLSILRRPALVAAAALVALSAATTACGGGGGSPESDLRGRVDDYLEAVLENDSETIAEISFPPSLRGNCSIDELAAGLEESSGQEFDEDFDPSEAGVQDVELELHSDEEATVTYYATYEGIANPFPVEFDWMKEDGDWYLDLGQAGPCDSGLADGNADDDSSSSNSSDSTSEAAVRERFEELLARVQDEDWDGLYGMLSERMRDGCSKTDYVELSSSEFEDSDADPADYKARNVDITVEDDLATVTYDVAMPGFEVVSMIDYWVYEDGEWRDDGNDDLRFSNGCGDDIGFSDRDRTAMARTNATTTAAAPRATATRPRTTPTARPSATVRATSPTPASSQPDGPYGTTATVTGNVAGAPFAFGGSRCELTEAGTILKIEIRRGSDLFSLVATGFGTSTVQQTVSAGQKVGFSLSVSLGGQNWIATSGADDGVMTLDTDLRSGTISGVALPGEVQYSATFTC